MREINDEYFKTGFRVGYRGTRPDLRTGFAALMEYMQEASIRHTDSTEYPMKWYAANSRGFLMSAMHVKVFSYPSLNDEISILTAPVSLKGFLAERLYCMSDSGGRTLAQARSLWIYADLESRRPTRIPEFIALSYEKPYENPPKADYTIPDVLNADKSSMFEKISEDSFKVTRRDTDSNSHVNNVVYLDWAQNYIPAEIFHKRDVVEMKAKYKKECREGDLMTAETYAHKEKPEFITVFFNNGGEEANAIIYTIYGSL